VDQVAFLWIEWLQVLEEVVIRGEPVIIVESSLIFHTSTCSNCSATTKDEAQIEQEYKFYEACQHLRSRDFFLTSFEMCAFVVSSTVKKMLVVYYPDNLYLDQFLPLHFAPLQPLDQFFNKILKNTTQIPD
jgi:hypothetical protein